MLHYCSHVLVQKPSPKSKPCTLPEICLTSNIPLLMKGRWPRPRNRLKRFQTVKQGGTNNTHIFIQLHTATGLRCKLWYFVFSFLDESWFSSEEQSLCFFSFCWLLFGQKARKLRTDHCKDDARTSYECSMQQCFKSTVDLLYIFYRGVVFFCSVLGGHLVVLWYSIHIQWP